MSVPARAPGRVPGREDRRRRTSGNTRTATSRPSSSGYVGEISETQLKELKGYTLGDRIGQGGIEAAFDKELRGQAGLNQLRVDSLGRPTSPAR